MIGSETGGVWDAVTESEVGVGDVILERMGEELGKVLNGIYMACFISKIGGLLVGNLGAWRDLIGWYQ